MHALVLQDYLRLEYREMPKPAIAPREVLVAVHACGICGSDVHGMDGSTGRRQPPLIMGHEAAGVIAEIGSEVEGWCPGDRVTFDSTVYCGTCAYCRTGRANLCDNRRVLGVSCADYRQHGAFAEYVAVPEHVLYGLPQELTFEQAAMAEPVSIAAHAVNRVNVGREDTAVVVGVGMIGLLVVQMLRVRGCGRIIAIDIDNAKRDLALTMGAHACIEGSAGAADEVYRLAGDQGADIAFEVVGVAASLATAVHAVRKGGAVVLVGNVSPVAELPLQAAVTRELTLYGSCASNGEYPEALNLMAEGKIEVGPIISAVAPLSEGAEWFERLYNREPGLMKVLLRP